MFNRLVSLAVVALAGGILLSSAEVGAQTSPMRARSASSYRTDCVRELRGSPFEAISPGDPGLQEIADSCRDVGASDRGIRAARARLHSGRAYRMLGQIDNAIRQLEIAVNAGPDFGRDFARDLRQAQLELIQAYRMKGRTEAARNLLDSSSLAVGDPAVAYQRAMLTLADLGEAGKEGAFNTLKGVFIQADTQLLNSPDTPLSAAEIQSGRSWVYWLGMSLGENTLSRQSRDTTQRLNDAQRAVDYFRPATDAIRAACPDRVAPRCTSSIGGTEQIGAIGYASAPSDQQLQSAFFQLGVAHLRAAGVPEAAGLSAVGQAGGLDCLSGAPGLGVASHIQNATDAFGAIMTRYPGFAADANWGMGCAILAYLTNARDANEQQRWLVQAVNDLKLDTSNRPDTLLTLARAQVMQGPGQVQNARGNFQKSIACLPVDGPELQNARVNNCTSADQTYATAQRDPSFRAHVKELRSRIYVEMARTYYLEVDPTHLVTQTNTDLFARAITEIESAPENVLAGTQTDLNRALGENTNNAEARLLLGHIYLRQHRSADAARVLNDFARAGAENTEGGAEGLFLLSMRLTQIEQDRLEPEHRLGRPIGGAQAVDYATRAFNSNQTVQFRRQACLSRMVFGDTRDDRYCSAANGNRGIDRAEALLFEGMFWLRRGQHDSGRLRLNSWSRAIQAFGSGYREATVDQVLMPEQLNLQALHRYGERYVQHCARLDYADPERADPDVRTYFRRSGMPDPCG